MGRVYKHEGRSNCGKGIKWTDATDSRERNATWRHMASSPDRAHPKDRTQRSADRVVDRNIAKGDAGQHVRTDREYLAARNESREQQRETVAFLRRTRKDDAETMVRAYLFPGDTDAGTRKRLGRYLKRNGLI